MNDKKEHILIIVSEFPPLPGGIGNHGFNLATHLAKNHFEVELIADQRSDDLEYERNFDQKLNFKVHRISLNKRRWIMYFKRLHVLFRNIKRSETVIASGKFPLWAVGFSSLFFNKKFIAVIHGSEVNFSNPILRYSINKALKRFSEVIAVSNYTRSLVSDSQLMNVQVIPNGFNASQWKQTEPTELKGDPKLITVGNVTERKGQLNVIKHLPQLLKKYRNLHYHCVGFPTEADDFKEVARALHVEDHVSFHGHVKHEDLHGFISASDVFVMLSTKTKEGDVEGFGIAILEANYLGVPGIGARGCGIEDAIADHSSGILITPTDTSMFENALTEILDHKSLYAANARSWASKHTWDIVIQSYIAIIQGK